MADDTANNNSAQEILESYLTSRTKKKTDLENLSGMTACSAIPMGIDYLYHAMAGQKFDITDNFFYYAAIGSGFYQSSWGHNGSSFIGYLVSISPQVFSLGSQALSHMSNLDLIDYKDDAETMLYKALWYGIGFAAGKIISDGWIVKKSKTLIESLGKGFGRGR